MNTDATMHTFAAPPIPCCLTAVEMNGTVALAVPPIRTGFLPRNAVTGAVITEVRTPSTGGRPIRAAMERPYGRAISAAITPPKQSPANNRQLYRRAFRNIEAPGERTARDAIPSL